MQSCIRRVMSSMQIKLIYSLVIFWLFSFNVSMAADMTLTIATSVKANTLSFRVEKKLLDQVSQRIQLPLKLVHIPANRASHLFRLGKIDAEFSRISQYQEIAPNGVIAQEPISVFPIYVFSAYKNFSVNSWQSLKPYRILVVKGWIFTKDKLAGFDTVEVDSPFQALRMLKAGRGEVFVADLFSVSSTLNALEFDSGDIKQLDTPVTVLDTDTFFLAKHAVMAKAYSKALTTLKREGVYEKI